MRKPSACAACRSRRRKCHIEEGQAACLHCSERGLPCDFVPPEGGYYDQRAQRRGEHAALKTQRDDGGGTHHMGVHTPVSRPATSIYSDGPSSPAPASLPGLALRLDLVRLYFDYIHDQFHSLFHRPSFIEDVLHDRVPPAIIFGMMSLSARFSTDPFFADVDPRERGMSYLVEGEALFNMHDVSLTTIQLCVLLGSAWTASGNAVAENIYYGIACRMAQLMDLPNRPASSQLESEINIRVWWSLSMIDAWSSAAVKLPKLLPNRTDLPLPMDDLSYLALSPALGGSPGFNTSFSQGALLLAQMVKLNVILQEVNHFNQSCVVENPSWDALSQGVDTMTARLDGWIDQIPHNLRDTPENFAWFASRGLGRMFAAVYLGYYHFGQLLYYQFLHGAATDPSPSPSLVDAPDAARRNEYARLCKDHAGKLCEMVYRAYATADSDVRYTMTSHVLVIASTVQIHTLLFSGDEDDISVARRRLERNFELLLRLQTYWPTVDKAISRLRAFHATARTSQRTSFVLDRWMLRFMVEWAESMEEKEAEAWRGSSEEMEALWNCV
ncbi:fungal-specific transcription factor domain-containing protein [Plectosphaerella plurivora]|uniref:Fungal-specific transcription factor domain-containing protein n=1 Tax=Plectosphaerella plurivora TaxID=936078 RepID=A0A9P8VGI4_9PEZI|nr:fungal-specific transcription factor domain-containing protein [Plectosphaerella plurivora]